MKKVLYIALGGYVWLWLKKWGTSREAKQRHSNSNIKS